jgi:EAL domain-containing protein (putative c-di-GMP-specific phosphodiesterase class I)
MYEAKEQGRGQFRFASGEAGKSSKKRVEVETMLRNAMSSDNLLLYYQPQVSAGSASSRSNRGLVGAEALIRLRNASGSIIGPDAFIDVAEETGLIVPIGEWALLTACAEAKRWLDMGKAIPVAVNVSQRQFEHSRIIEQTARALKESGLPPHLLKLEVTESLFMKDSDRAAAIMGELKAMGVTFAVDDFGTGYSSLRYIDTLPIDCLKIDKSFIQRIGAEDNDSAVALAVVSLARSFGLESIAEGVETEDQLSALRARGCDTIQGYFISKPLESSVFRSFLAENAHTAVPPVSGETGRGETPEPAPIEEELEELEEIL